MGLRKYERISGAVHDYQRLLELPADDCNILIVSSRTLHLLANYAGYEANWYARFLRDLGSGGMVSPIRAGDAEAPIVDEIANNFRLEVVPVTCDFVAALNAQTDVLRLILAAMQAGGVNGCGCITIGPGEDAPSAGDDPDDHGGEPPTGFDDWTAYDEYKCRYANRIVDEFIELLTRMIGLLPAAAGLGIAAIVALIAGVIAGGWSILIILAVGVGTAALTVFTLIATIILADDGLAFFTAWAAELEATKESAVCAMFVSQTPEAARAAIVTWMSDAAAEAVVGLGNGTLLGDLADQLIAAAVNNNLVNRMFPDLAQAEFIPIDYIGDIDCTGCVADCAFGFVTGSGGLVYTGSEFELSSEDLGGGVHSLQIVTTCTDANWCVIFTQVPAGLVCPNPSNYTRRLYSTANGTNSYHNIGYENASPDCYFPIGVRLPLSGFSVANDAAFTVRLRIINLAPSVDNEPPEASTDCD